MTIMCSLEVCFRLYKETKREQDPDLDNLKNPHEVKHWMDPKIIPFGWGQFEEREGWGPFEGTGSVITVEKGELLEQIFTKIIHVFYFQMKYWKYEQATLN